MKLKRSAALAFGLSLSEYGFGASAQEVELDEGMHARLLNDLGKSIETLNRAVEEKQEILDTIFGKDAEGDQKDLANKIKLQAEAGEAHLKGIRDDAKKFAKLAGGKDEKDELNPAIAKAIDNATLEDAQGFLEEYRTEAEKKFPAKCPKCGTVLTRGSAVKGEEPEADDGEEVNKENYEY